MDSNTKLNVPGPGTYQSVNSLTNTGKYFFSRFKDSGNNALRSTAVRFGEQNKMIAIVPGPGKYDELKTINKTGKNFLSKFGSSLCGKFDHTKRDFALDSPRRKSILS